MKYSDHDAGNGHAYTRFNQQDTQMLTMDRIMFQYRIVQETPPHYHAGNTDAGIGERAQRHQHT